MNVRILRTISMCGLCLLYSGCFFTGSSSEEETEAYVAEEHLHHEIPDHMPEDFPDAVQKIRERDEHLREDVSAGEWEHVEHELPELIDILEWLPKLAADSDLNKQEWEQVQKGADKLGRLYQPLTAGSQPEGWGTDQDSRKLLDSILSEFDQLIEKYPGGFEKVLGEHDHEDHDHHDH